MEAATTKQQPEQEEQVSSFAKSLFLGEIHEDLVFPFPKPDPAEQDKIRSLTAAMREIADEMYDPRKVEEERWIGDDVIAAMGERGLLGLYVPEEYGGQGLSQMGYCRVSQEFSLVDSALSVVMGVHQSIGMKGIVMYGNDEQKERLLPDLASGRKLAGFALTEPNAGSDVKSIESRAERQADGSWRLNGMKHYIGNGGKGSVFVTFAATGEGEITAFILEKGMEGFEVGKRFDTLGLRGNDLRELHFKDVRVPPENVLGAAGEGFRIAMHVLNNGRLSIGTGAVGGSKSMLDNVIRHVRERRQFGRPLADFELVQDKIGWMVAYTFGLESMAYLTTGLVDRGVPDYSLESAILKVAATEFLWYEANRALQLAGGSGYMRDQPYEKRLRDIRVFPIFEGANDVMRSFIALAGLKPLGEDVGELADISLGDPIGSLGVLADYVASRVRREVAPDRITKAHEALDAQAAVVTDQVKRLRSVGESLLREHKGGIIERQFHQKRLAAAVSDIYAQVAVLSRVTDHFDEHGLEPSGQERYIAETFCERAAARVGAALDQVERNDDERMVAIAKLAYKRGEYGYSFFED
ncbi:MAG: acyl-CoA dehydrogenase family protein [Thermoleophilaceae bacterium]